MASYTMHLAIAKLYLNIHKEEVEEDFYKGTTDVDDVKDKALTHYSTNVDSQDVRIRMLSKVDIKKYVEEHSIKTSYDRGYFLHLLTDYFFYNNYFNYKDFEHMNVDEYDLLLYNEYDILNKHLLNKYEVKVPERLNKRYFEIHEGNLQISTYESIDDFIEFMSNLDIDDLYSKIERSENILYMYKRKEN